MKIVEIEWIDAQSSMDFISIEDLIKEPVKTTKSCGYLIHQDKDKTILAFMVFDKDFIKHYQIIPTKMIIRIKCQK